MPGKHDRLDPKTVKRVMEAAAAAKDEVIHKSALDALMNTSPEDLIAPEKEPEVIKGNARRPGCWLESPAMLKLFAAADKRLTRVATLDKIEVKRVEKVHARLIPDTKMVLLKAARVEDATAIPVNRYSNSVSINLISLLGDRGLTVESGYRERYEILYIPEGSPHWPGLFFDLSDVKERRHESSSKKGTDTEPEVEVDDDLQDELDQEPDDM